jgi:hypothetical protein
MSYEDLPPVATTLEAADPPPAPETTEAASVKADSAGLMPQHLARKLTVGTWIELLVAGVWQRTQLSWISPQGTMYMFTDLQAKTQAMTQRMFDRMLAESILRVVSDQILVDGALDAVVTVAMHNSLDDMN